MRRTFVWLAAAFSVLVLLAVSAGAVQPAESAEGVSVPTLADHHALEARVDDLEARVAALEAEPTPEPEPTEEPTPEPTPEPPDPDGTPDWTTFDVRIAPGDDMQAAFDAHPGGKVVLAAGVHTGYTNLKPTEGQHIVGEPGAVIDGQGVNAKWLNRGGDNVTVENVEVRNYHFTPDSHWDGAINARNTYGWTIRYVHSHDNSSGVTLGSGATLEHSLIHDNWQQGIMSRGSVFSEWENSQRGTLVNNRIFRNGLVGQQQGKADSAAMKLSIYNAGLDFVNNWVHDNHIGVWLDIDNCALNPCRIASNLIENNGGNSQLLHEISFDTIVEWNIIRGGGSNGTVYNSTSQNVTYRENAVDSTSTAGGVGIINMRHADIRAKATIGGRTRGGENLSWHDNDVRGNNWIGYRFNDVVQPGVIDRNIYRTDGLDYYARPDLSPGTFAQWQALGFDINGEQRPHNSGEPQLPDHAEAFEEAHYGVWSG